MRLIDADNLLKALKNEKIETNEIIGKARKLERMLCIQYINTEPTVNERPQGEWVTDDATYSTWRCNKCLHVQTICSNFCPNCGADMRGEEE